MTFFNFMNGHTFYLFVWITGLTTALLTAFYMTRVYFLTFRGEERFALPKAAKAGHGDHGKDTHGHDDGHGHDQGLHAPHESPALMTIPLYILAGLAIIGGFLGLPAVVKPIFGDHFHLLNGWLGGLGRRVRLATWLASALHGSFSRTFDRA